MKQIKNLYDQIPTYENLRLAFRKAIKGKQTKKEVILFRKHFDDNMRNLQMQIINGQPDVGHYRFFVIRDPKVRSICAASFPERVLHHAIMNVCEPYLDTCAIYDSYACRKGKGNRKALERAKIFARKNAWYLKLDIRKYFDSIDHDIAMKLLSKRFGDHYLLMLFKKILDSYHTKPGRGVPIGNLISQHLANFYLGGFDHWIKEVRKIRAYIRYMDDFVLFAESRRILKAELSAIEDYLDTKLNLSLKENIQLNRTNKGLPFLGFRVFPCHLRLMARSAKRFSKKMRQYERNYYEGRWTERELVRHMEPLTDFTNAGDSLRIRRLIIERFGVLF